MTESWKARATVEFVELDYRVKALERIIETRDFPSSTPDELLERQLKAMREYRACLCDRASLEGYDVPEVV